MQPVIGLCNQIKLVPKHLLPENYIRFLAEQLSHNEAASRLRNLYQKGFSSAFYDRDQLIIRFRDQLEFEKFCNQAGSTAETVQRRYFDVSPARWDPLIVHMTHSPKVGVFNFCIGEDHERTRLQQVPICMADCHLLNAGAIPVPSGGEAILLNSGITFGGGLARLIYKYSSQYGRSLTNQEIANTMSSFLHLARFVIGVETDADSVASAIVLAHRELLRESRVDTRGAIISMFILMHEYGHVQLDHLEIVRQINIDQLSERQRKSLFRVMRNCEYKADNWAYTRMLEADWSPCASKRDPDGRITAALSICLAFEFLYLAEVFRGSCESDSDTHPPARRRKKKFINYCIQKGLTSDIIEEQLTLMQSNVNVFATINSKPFVEWKVKKVFEKQNEKP